MVQGDSPRRRAHTDSATTLRDCMSHIVTVRYRVVNIFGKIPTTCGILLTDCNLVWGFDIETIIILFCFVLFSVK